MREPESDLGVVATKPADTPRPQKRRGAVGLLAHLEGQTVAFPEVKRHTMPFK